MARIDEMIAEMPDYLTGEEKMAIARNNLEMEKALKIKKGKPMDCLLYTSLGCVKQLLAGGKVFGFSLVFVGIHLRLQVGGLFRKDRYLACLVLQLVHQAEHSRITRAVLEARAFLYVFQIHVFSVFLWLNEPVIE